MESRRILVTGGAGFMGSHICSELINKGFSDIYCIDDLSGGDIYNINEHLKNNELEFIKLDLSDKNAKNIITDIKPEIIFYLAANAREGASYFQPLEIAKRNYYGYINTIEPAISTGELDKVILFSSMAVYGDQGLDHKPPFSEDMKRMPIDIYGINKAAMEHSTELLSDIHEFNYTIIRPHNVFGENQSLRDPYRNVIAIFMNRIMRKEPIYIYGDGEQKRAFSYIQDSLPCYIECIDDRANGEIINIGGKYPITINELTETVCKYMNVSHDTYPIKHLPDRPNEVKNAYCTWQKSAKVLGYDENIGIKEGISRMSIWARGKGPQEWSEEELTLWNKKAPIIWKRIPLCKIDR